MIAALFAAALHASVPVEARTLVVEGGFPRVGLGFAWPLARDADFGLRFERLVSTVGTLNGGSGLGLRAPLRQLAARRGAVDLLVRAEPGLKLRLGRALFGPAGRCCIESPRVVLGASLPVALELGVTLGDLRAGVGAELEVISWNIWRDDRYDLTPLFGVDLDLARGDTALGLELRMGVSQAVSAAYYDALDARGPRSDLAFRALLRIAFR